MRAATYRSPFEGGGGRGEVRRRSDKELEPLISFVTFYIADPLYTTTLLTVANIILGARERRG